MFAFDVFLMFSNHKHLIEGGVRYDRIYTAVAGGFVVSGGGVGLFGWVPL